MKIAFPARHRPFSGRVIEVPVGDIVPNPNQPRRRFDPESLRELSDSLRLLGVIQPLTVRKLAGGYELVAGERRLRAARMAGLTTVPCLVRDLGDGDSSLVALVENLQRRDLDCFEEAEGVRQLIDAHGLTQDEAARRIGKSQSAVANKLRLLRLDRASIDTIRQNALTERHARALLALDDPEKRRTALDLIIKQSLNVAQTEHLIQCMLAPKRRGNRPLLIIKDVRLFLNTINRAVDVMKSAGIPADLQKQDSENEILLMIKIPKAAIQAKNVSRETLNDQLVAQTG